MSIKNNWTQFKKMKWYNKLLYLLISFFLALVYVVGFVTILNYFL